MHSKKEKSQCHHVDANIILSAIGLDGNKKNIKKEMMVCKNVLTSIANGNGRFGGICTITLGEVFDKIIKVPDEDTRKSCFAFVCSLFADGGFEIYGADDNDIKLFHELRKHENRGHMPELIALSVAINNNGAVFITDDKALCESESLKSHVFDEHKMHIKHSYDWGKRN